MKLMHLAKVVALAMGIAGLSSADSAEQLDGHFSTWEEVPGLIDSITRNSYGKQLEQLHDVTRIKMGFPQSSLCLSDEEHQQYMLRTQHRWKQWWESTGKPVSKRKKRHSKVDQAAFRKAWEFLGTKQRQPREILPVWVPDTWALYVTFTNGDYMGREKEVWIVDRQASSARLTKLRGDYSRGRWAVTLKECNGFTAEKADQLLKALCYLHRYAPEAGKDVPKDSLKGLYYPHSTLHLRDGKNRVLWNTEGYEFRKVRPEYGDGESGRSYYFLRSVFSDEGEWKVVSDPTSQALAPYRMFLSFSKPYFAPNAYDIIQLFGEHGGELEIQAMLEWADKQKAATNPEMEWEVCCDDFGTGLKVNVINFTRSAIEETLREIGKAVKRLEAEQKAGRDVGGDGIDTYKAKERELNRYVTAMLALEKREEEEAIQRFPQPLRDLIIADEHPNDSDLKHLSAAIQAIRSTPDPTLFAQLVQEMHEGTLKIRSLLNHILLNEHDLLDLKAWEAREEAIAVAACIDSLPLAKDSAKDDLVETLLRVCGGGKIEIEGAHGGRSIEIIPTKNGYKMTLGGASDPLSLGEAQKELRRLYTKSRAEQSGAAPKSKREDNENPKPESEGRPQ